MASLSVGQVQDICSLKVDGGGGGILATTLVGLGLGARIGRAGGLWGTLGGGIVGAIGGLVGGEELLWAYCKDRSDRLSRLVNGFTQAKTIGVNRPDQGAFEQVRFDENTTIPIHYFEKGRGNKTKGTLLLLHSFGGNAYQWSKVFDELAENYHVIAPDFPGFGYSGFTLDDNYDFITRLPVIFGKFMEQKGLKQVTVAGTSMGGSIGIRLAVSPVAGPFIKNLVLFDAPGSAGKPPGAPWWFDIAAKGYSVPAGVEKFSAKYVLATSAHPSMRGVGEHDVEQFSLPYVAKATDETQVAKRVKARAFYASAISHYGSDPKIQEHLVGLQKQVSVPTLIVWSKTDPLVPEEVPYQMAHDMKHASLVILPESFNAAHSPELTNPRVVIDLIDSYMKGKIVEGSTRIYESVRGCK